MFFQHNAIRALFAVTLSAGMAFPAIGAEAGASEPPSSKPHHAKKKTAPPRSTLEGRIFAADGKTGVRGATLELRPLDGSATGTSAPTDSRGRFRIKGLEYGWAEIVVHTSDGQFLGDQAINLPPGRKISATFSVLQTADRPESWWKDRNVEPPPDLASSLSGMAAAQQRLTGVEYWKSPKGIAILIAGGILALGLVAAGGSYTPPANAQPATQTP